MRRAVELALVAALGAVLGRVLAPAEAAQGQATDGAEACRRAEEMAEAALAATLLVATDTDAIKAGCVWLPGTERLEFVKAPRKPRW